MLGESILEAAAHDQSSLDLFVPGATANDIGTGPLGGGCRQDLNLGATFRPSA
jgi:hypothetical protein